MTHIRLDVFDLTGRKVAKLVDGVRPAGSHVVEFDASSLSSGIYLYKLAVDKQHIVRKMVVAR